MSIASAGNPESMGQEKTALSTKDRLKQNVKSALTKTKNKAISLKTILNKKVRSAQDYVAYRKRLHKFNKAKPFEPK
jgi:hypothetical protein